MQTNPTQVNNKLDIIAQFVPQFIDLIVTLLEEIDRNLFTRTIIEKGIRYSVFFYPALFNSSKLEFSNVFVFRYFFLTEM